MSRMLMRVGEILQRAEYFMLQFFGKFPPPESLSFAGIDWGRHTSLVPTCEKTSELSWDGIFWAVPKHRRTVEKRLNRKFGHPQYVWKPYEPKKNLRLCNECGSHFEVGLLCPVCYKKIRKETEQMQEKIQEELGLDPVEKEVVVLYEGENNQKITEFSKGKRIVEMKKPRPMWFSRNLIQKTTQPEATTKEVKPDNLG